jgi:hypothetical protein
MLMYFLFWSSIFRRNIRLDKDSAGDSLNHYSFIRVKSALSFVGDSHFRKFVVYRTVIYGFGIFGGIAGEPR